MYVTKLQQAQLHWNVNMIVSLSCTIMAIERAGLGLPEGLLQRHGQAGSLLRKMP